MCLAVWYSLDIGFYFIREAHALRSSEHACILIVNCIFGCHSLVRAKLCNRQGGIGKVNR